MNELIQALEQVQQQRGIDKEVIFQAIETSLQEELRHIGQCYRYDGPHDR